MNDMNLRKAVRLHCMECNGEVKGGKKYDCLGRMLPLPLERR